MHVYKSVCLSVCVVLVKCRAENRLEVDIVLRRAVGYASLNRPDSYAELIVGKEPGKQPDYCS